MSAFMRRSFVLAHVVTCNRCEHDVAVMAFGAPSVTCGNCRHLLRLSEAYWLERFARDRDFRPWAPRAGETGASANRGIARMKSYLRYGVAEPVCAACDAPVAVPETDFAPVTCACGATIAIRAAPDLARAAIDPACVALVDEGRVGGRGVPVTYAIVDHDEAQDRAFRWNLDSEQLADAARPLSPALFAQLAAHGILAVREAIAANPSADPAVLATLATDEHISVRIAVTENLATPEPTFAALVANERDERVLKAIAKRHVLPPSVIEALVGAVNSDARRLALSRRELPKPLLDRLATDNEPDIRKAALKKGGGTWFQRLMG